MSSLQEARVRAENGKRIRLAFRRPKFESWLVFNFLLLQPRTLQLKNHQERCSKQASILHLKRTQNIPLSTYWNSQSCKPDICFFLPDIILLHCSKLSWGEVAVLLVSSMTNSMGLERVQSSLVYRPFCYYKSMEGLGTFSYVKG